MTNLSDLFPAGAGKQVSFVADGAISAAGKPVILNSAGTVTQVSAVAAAIGSPTTFSTGNVDKLSGAFDINAGKFLIAYQDIAAAEYGYCVVGTVSGTTVSYGTPVVLNSATTYNTACIYDPDAQKIVVSYSNGNIGTAVVATISGTTVSFGTPVVFNTPGNTNYHSLSYDTAANKVVFAYQNGGAADVGTARVATVSGTSISFGTAVVFENAVTGYIGSVFDPNAGKVVMVYQDGGNSSYGTAIVGTVSATNISFGSAVVYTSASCRYNQVEYDTASTNVSIVYQNEATTYGNGIVGTVSGTSMTFGTAVAWNAVDTNAISTAYNSAAGTTCITYYEVVAKQPTLIEASISGTTISFNTKVVLDTFSGTPPTGAVSSCFDSTNDSLISFWNDPDSTNDGSSIVTIQGYTSLTATNFIGISDAAISDTASGNVTIKGGIAATGLTSLTSGSDYYAQGDGTISTVTTSPAVKIGRAMSATSINLEYQS